MILSARPMGAAGLVAVAAVLGWLVSLQGVRVPLAIALVPLLAMLVSRPQWSLWLLIASIPVTADFGSGLTVSRVVMPVVVLSVAAAVLLHRCPPPRLFGSPAARAASLLMLAVLLSMAAALLGRHPQFDLELAGKELAAYATRFALFFVTLALVRDERDFRNALRALVLAGALEALVVVAQVHFRLVLPGDWRFSAKYNVELGEGVFRAEGTTAHPVFLAGYLQMVMPVALWLVANERRGLRLVAALSFVLVLYAWSAAYSRSSLLGLVAMAALAVSLWSRTGRFTVLAVGVALVLGLSAHGWSLTDFAQTLEDLRQMGQQVRADQLSPAASSLQFRLESTVGAWNLFLEHPLFGVGPAQARYHYVDLLPDWAVSLFHPNAIHNAFLEVACEIGALGLVALVALWRGAFGGLIRAWDHPRLGSAARMLAVVLVGQAVFLAMTPTVRDVWFTLAMAAALGTIVAQPGAVAVAGARRGFGAAGAA